MLRLDTDWYESTRHELEHLYPRLVPGGVLIIDDYGYWAGARKAVDEYFSDKPILLNRLDNTGRIAVK
ncbi:TylF/MycF/NovP-related O-methyltransferase [Komagataeibacter melomenusus]|uniref:TylF/MycF/NovP-related O-methyltransferase n=1 Tax=Komagataeibacter melomenusus TaxID=2766578 RepID=UPI0034D2C6C6